MTTKEVYEMLKRDWGKNFPFTLHQRDDGFDYISSYFHNNKKDIKFLLELKILEDNLLMDFTFGKVSDFDKAVYYANEFNKHTMPCFKAYINNNKYGDYFHIGFLVGVKTLEDANHHLMNAMGEIVSDSTFKYISPLYALLIEKVKLENMA